MGIISRFADNMNLMADMFARSGALSSDNLDESAMGGVRQAMMRCAKCRHTDECKAFLAGAGDHLDPPGYCENANLIRAMRPG